MNGHDMNDPGYMRERITRLIEDLFSLRDQCNALSEKNRFQAGKIAALTQVVLRYQDKEAPDGKEAISILREIAGHRDRGYNRFPTPANRFDLALDRADEFIGLLDQPKAGELSSALE